MQSFETGGQANPYTSLNYAYDPTHTASGAYQITNTLWNHYAPAAGINTSLYPTAASAPAASQDATFAQIVQARGLSDWTCPGCNPGLSSYLATNPSAASLPIMSGGSAVPSQSAAPAGATPTKPAGSVLSPSTWFSSLGDWIASVAARGGLFIVGLVFILGALALFAIKSGIDIETHAS